MFFLFLLGVGLTGFCSSNKWWWWVCLFWFGKHCLVNQFFKTVMLTRLLDSKLEAFILEPPVYHVEWQEIISSSSRPMEEQRHRYGPPLYSLTAMVIFIRLFLFLSWGRFDANKLWDILHPLFVNLLNLEVVSLCNNLHPLVVLTLSFVCFVASNAFLIMLKLRRKRHQVAILEQAVDVYTSEFESFIKFIRY